MLTQIDNNLYKGPSLMLCTREVKSDLDIDRRLIK